MSVTRTKTCIFVGLLLGYLCIKVNWQYEHPGWTRSVNITGSIINFQRNADMLLVSRGKNTHIDFFKALGWSHAHDRYVQLCIFRLASTGRLTDHLPFNEKLFKQDVKSRQMNFAESNIKSLPNIPADKLAKFNAYTDGINTYMATHPRPIEFIMFNYHPEPFTISDLLSIYKFIAYSGLNDICLIVEKLIIEIARETDQVDLMKLAFNPHLDQINDELIEIYKSVRDLRPTADQNTDNIPKLTNSNNWAVSGKLSETGSALLASDPHMDISNLPNIFYENQFVGEDGYTVFGISAAGIPGIVMGRSNHISFGITFGMLDMSDYFIENVQDMKYERDGKFYPLIERVEKIAGKEYYYYDTSDGHTIERKIESMNTTIENGRYLAARYALTVDADVRVIDLFFSTVTAKTVHDIKDVVTINLLGTNYVLADTSGNIAYVQGGNVPIRTSTTGLLPLPAWKSENLWQGYLAPDQYMSIVNPPEGFVATANNYIQDPDKPPVATFSALSNRVNRIKQLLQSKEKFTTEDFKRFQSDTYSLLAEQIVPIISPFLGDSGIEAAVKEWDFISTQESKPAAFFKLFYKRFTRNILLQFFSQEHVDKYTVYCAYPLTVLVDKILRAEDPALLPPTVIQQTVAETLAAYNGEVYGEVEKIDMKNMIFGGKLPAWLGLDSKDMSTNHCTECVKVGNPRHSQMGAPVYISQAWRMVTDMGTNVIESVLPGGPSGNILSNFYMREIKMFLEDQYKKIEL